jgi:DNA-binding response OmpR family regulator
MKVKLKDISNRKVLIIDDEVDLCLLMKSYFLRKNCHVLISHTIEDALNRISKEVPDLIFLDSSLCKDLKETGDKLLEAAPMAWLIITGENRANSYFDYVG